MSRERAAALTARRGAPRFPAPRLKGAGFGSCRPGSGADFRRGPSTRPGLCPGGPLAEADLVCCVSGARRSTPRALHILGVKQVPLHPLIRRSSSIDPDTQYKRLTRAPGTAWLNAAGRDSDSAGVRACGRAGAMRGLSRSAASALPVDGANSSLARQTAAAPAAATE